MLFVQDLYVAVMQRVHMIPGGFARGSLTAFLCWTLALPATGQGPAPAPAGGLPGFVPKDMDIQGMLATTEADIPGMVERFQVLQDHIDQLTNSLANLDSNVNEVETGAVESYDHVKFLTKEIHHVTAQAKENGQTARFLLQNGENLTERVQNVSAEMKEFQTYMNEMTETIGEVINAGLWAKEHLAQLKQDVETKFPNKTKLEGRVDELEKRTQKFEDEANTGIEPVVQKTMTDIFARNRRNLNLFADDVREGRWPPRPHGPAPAPGPAPAGISLRSARREVRLGLTSRDEGSEPSN